MDEAAWLACADPTPMLAFLRDRASSRKLRLFACACVRQVWHLLTEDRSRAGIAVSERYADGLASTEELLAAAIQARKIDDTAARAVWPAGNLRDSFWRAGRAAESAAEAAERAAAFVAVKVHPNRVEAAMQAAGKDQRGRQCDLLRDLFGNPFRPVVLDPTWLGWNGGLVTQLAKAASDNCDLSAGTLDLGRLAVLADALEEAGCDNGNILGHLRGPGPHMRGCHILDVCLEKA